MIVDCRIKWVEVGDTMVVYLDETDNLERPHYPGIRVVVNVVIIYPFTSWFIPRHVSLRVDA